MQRWVLATLSLAVPLLGVWADEKKIESSKMPDIVSNELQYLRKSVHEWRQRSENLLEQFRREKDLLKKELEERLGTEQRRFEDARREQNEQFHRLMELHHRTWQEASERWQQMLQQHLSRFVAPHMPPADGPNRTALAPQALNAQPPVAGSSDRPPRAASAAEAKVPILSAPPSDDGSTITLIRKTYSLREDQAKALADFLKAFVQTKVLETSLEGGKLTITTTPEVQEVITQVVGLMTGKSVKRLGVVGVLRPIEVDVEAASGSRRAAIKMIPGSPPEQENKEPAQPKTPKKEKDQEKSEKRKKDKVVEDDQPTSKLKNDDNDRKEKKEEQPKKGKTKDKDDDD